MTGNSLSIRQYCIEPSAHQHTFHQLVFPIQGSLSMLMESFVGTVRVGECLVIPAGMTHQFHANEHARFIVADLEYLPEFMSSATHPIFFLSNEFRAFLQFIEIHLQESTSSHLHQPTMSVFFALLNGLSTQPKLDKRVLTVITVLTRAPHLRHDIETMAKHACLSPSQFKLLFKQQLGQSPKSYLTQLRMNKAKALLLNTDTPISLVAEQVGYADHSAFSRRFSEIFGLSPSALR